MNRIIKFSERLSSPGGSIQGNFPEEKEDVINSNEQLLNYIYGVDPATSLPCGDLAVYLGDKANPEIKYFIEQNLLNPISNAEGLSNLPIEVTNKFRELSDDDVANFARNHGESREEYADRIKLFFLKEKNRRREEGRLKDLEGLLNKPKQDER